MKILKIEDNVGEFTIDGINYKNINELNRNDIFSILLKILESPENSIEFDEVTDTNVILNDAQKVIYEKIYNKLSATAAKRNEILETVNNEVTPILEKYDISLED